jgi:hypothetical protein
MERRVSGPDWCHTRPLRSAGVRDEELVYERDDVFVAVLQDGVQLDGPLMRYAAHFQVQDVTFAAWEVDDLLLDDGALVPAALRGVAPS